VDLRQFIRPLFECYLLARQKNYVPYNYFAFSWPCSAAGEIINKTIGLYAYFLSENIKRKAVFDI
jgi:hypothetical protein